MLTITPTALPEVLILSPRRFADGRGFFGESWNAKRMAEHGLDINFVQDNHSFSQEIGTLRGLHYQSAPHAQGKLVRCGRGALWDVAVDIRVGSPNYGKWVGVDLTYENGLQLWIPPGFLHGFVTREPDTEIIYKCTAHYAPETEGAVRFDDPDLGIDWGLTSPPHLSDKDQVAPLLRDAPSPFRYDEVRP